MLHSLFLQQEKQLLTLTRDIRTDTDNITLEHLHHKTPHVECGYKIFQRYQKKIEKLFEHLLSLLYKILKSVFRLITSFIFQLQYFFFFLFLLFMEIF